MGDTPLLRNIQVTTVDTQFTIKQRKQTRFAGAVRADQCHLLAIVDTQAGFFKKHLRAALHGNLIKFDHICSLTIGLSSGVV